MYMAHAFDVGGAEDMVLNLVRHLPDRFEPMVCAIHHRGAIGREIQEAGIPTTVLGLNPGLRRPWDVARLHRFLRRSRPHIVHTFLLTASLYGRLAAMLARVPIIIGTEQNIYHAKRLRHALAEWLLMAATARVVASAASVREHYIRSVHVNPAKVDVIYNAVDWDHLQTTMGRDEMRNSLAIPAGTPVCAMIGRLTPQKGHVYAFEALARTPALARAHLIVAGDGELAQTLRNRAAALGIAGRVHFLGMRRDVGNVLSAAGVFVLPSLWEGLPLALVLAMGAGVPVVSTAVGGIPELVEDGRTGLLVRPADSLELGRALSQLLADPELCCRLAAAARTAVRPRFGIDACVASVTTLYDRLLEGRAA
jgi:glycosyltransferase involved in cell wall biosynthesis